MVPVSLDGLENAVSKQSTAEHNLVSNNGSFKIRYLGPWWAGICGTKSGMEPRGVCVPASVGRSPQIRRARAPYIKQFPASIQAWGRCLGPETSEAQRAICHRELRLRKAHQTGLTARTDTCTGSLWPGLIHVRALSGQD